MAAFIPSTRNHAHCGARKRTNNSRVSSAFSVPALARPHHPRRRTGPCPSHYSRLDPLTRLRSNVIYFIENKKKRREKTRKRSRTSRTFERKACPRPIMGSSLVTRVNTTTPRHAMAGHLRHGTEAAGASKYTRGHQGATVPPTS